MPYLVKEKRTPETRLDPTVAGELNYALTCLVERYRSLNGDCYQTFNDIEGALQCVSKEFYRRVVVPYEDKKKEANGDVFRV